LTIVCGEPSFAVTRSVTLLNPRVTIAVLGELFGRHSECGDSVVGQPRQEDHARNTGECRRGPDDRRPNSYSFMAGAGETLDELAAIVWPF
jgi:hypothetical protein